MIMPHSDALNSDPITDTSLNSENLIEQKNWVMDRAWISGLVGAVMIILCGLWYKSGDALINGVSVFGLKLTDNQTDSILLALAVVTLSMLSVEIIRLRKFYGHLEVSKHPALTRGDYRSFICDCVVNYLGHLGLLFFAMQFFYLANEYGYRVQAKYYEPWFRLLDIAFYCYLWAGLPYALVTRGFKYSKTADKRDYGIFFYRLVSQPVRRYVLRLDTQKASLYNDYDKKNARSLLVKLFFTPLMTVFFCDQFPHLVNNLGYLGGGFIENIFSDSYALSSFNNDLFNISLALIFSIDVGLAWCGYVVSTRWVGNQTVSAEPTVLGWIVCIVCYPPLQTNIGFYFTHPGERDIISLFSNQYLVTFLMICTIMSFFVYMLATLFFGTRFSNLTNRGIIRTGPFSIVRHPAYAAKNFAWWCVMFPAILYNATHAGWHLAVTQILGLVLITWIYYMRAITEERHLSLDPYYRAYCQKVKYRFIPRLL